MASRLPRFQLQQHGLVIGQARFPIAGHIVHASRQVGADKDEIAVVAKGLATATDKTRNTIASDMVWGLMTSPEYRFNH